MYRGLLKRWKHVVDVGCSSDQVLVGARAAFMLKWVVVASVNHRVVIM